LRGEAQERGHEMMLLRKSFTKVLNYGICDKALCRCSAEFIPRVSKTVGLVRRRGTVQARAWR